MDIEKVEADAKALASETTSIMSGMLSAINPRWTRFAETWKSWSLRKKAIALVIVASFGGFVSAFGVSTLRLISGSYRSAYAYGHGQGVTKSDVSGMAHMSDISRIQRQVDEIKSQLSKIDDTIDKAQASRITTGSIPAKKKRRQP